MTPGGPNDGGSARGREYSSRWSQLMGDRAIARSEHWERMTRAATSEEEKHRYGQQALICYLQALQFLAGREMTPSAFPKPGDVGADPMDQALYPEEESSTRGPGIDGEWMPCVLCGKPLRGTSVRREKDGPLSDNGRYCLECALRGP